MTDDNNNRHGIKRSFLFGASGALIASLCCITPMFIFLFGLGSLSFALSLTKYKPFFLAAGALFVLLAILYNNKHKTCSIDQAEIRKKKLFIIITIVVMILFYLLIQYLILPYLGKIVYV